VFKKNPNNDIFSIIMQHCDYTFGAKPVPERLGIGANTRVLVFSTEDATDPEYFETVMKSGV
jgi:hypothetical protein